MACLARSVSQVLNFSALNWVRGLGIDLPCKIELPSRSQMQVTRMYAQLGQQYYGLVQVSLEHTANTCLYTAMAPNCAEQQKYTAATEMVEPKILTL